MITWTRHGFKKGQKVGSTASTASSGTTPKEGASTHRHRKLKDYDADVVLGKFQDNFDKMDADKIPVE